MRLEQHPNARQYHGITTPQGRFANERRRPALRVDIVCEPIQQALERPLEKAVSSRRRVIAALFEPPRHTRQRNVLCMGNKKIFGDDCILAAFHPKTTH
jgi:hypothetical protein